MAHYTYRGKPIDISTLVMMNEHSVALGNANMNARGDILGKGGTVVKTAEQRSSEYYQQFTQNATPTDEEYAVQAVVPSSYTVQPVQEQDGEFDFDSTTPKKRK